MKGLSTQALSVQNSTALGVGGWAESPVGYDSEVEGEAKTVKLHFQHLHWDSVRSVDTWKHKGGAEGVIGEKLTSKNPKHYV